MYTDTEPMYGWESLPWFQLERQVFKLQKRIYQASARDDLKTVRRLQKLLIHNRAAKLLAVRRITQDNRGKNTPGIDGVCSLTPEERLELARNLKVGERADPVRRVYIPKHGTDELRPLGIPTMYDRALQTLVRLALEPEWEARFEPNSYGFRPGRSCWDAIAAVYTAINTSDKHVLDADIAKCFDRINHEALLKKVNAGSAITRQLRAWLKAGILDGERLFPSEEGTPQGGAISPLLANIALHGLETLIRQRFPRTQRTVDGVVEYTYTPNVVRYADDFVVLHKDEAVVRECQEVIGTWLRGMGLELKPSKTRIGHTLKETDGRVGFDFLGFTVRQFPAGATRSGWKTHGGQLGFKTLIKPSKEALRRHAQRLREGIDQLRNAPQAVLIGFLSPIIRGWTNYYSTCVSRKAFSRMDSVLFQMLRSWAYRRHPNKNRNWVVGKYWRVDQGLGWLFKPPGDLPALRRHTDTKIVRHAKVQGDRSPYDGDWGYWCGRMGRFPGVFPPVAIMLKRQKGKCNWCRLFFRPGDEMEVDHVRRKADGGQQALVNLQLLHRHCHQSKAAEECRRGMSGPSTK